MIISNMIYICNIYVINYNIDVKIIQSIKKDRKISRVIFMELDKSYNLLKRFKNFIYYPHGARQDEIILLVNIGLHGE